LDDAKHFTLLVCELLLLLRLLCLQGACICMQDRQDARMKGGNVAALRVRHMGINISYLEAPCKQLIHG
jgi:hypothetical protein